MAMGPTGVTNVKRPTLVYGQSFSDPGPLDIIWYMYKSGARYGSSWQTSFYTNGFDAYQEFSTTPPFDLPDGDWSFTVDLLRSGMFVGSGTGTSFKVDTVAPYASGPDASTYTNSTGSYRKYLYGVGDSVGVQRVNFWDWWNGTWIDRGAGVNAGGGTWYYDFPYRGDGQYQIDMRVYDNAGNVSNGNTAYTSYHTIDRVLPTGSRTDAQVRYLNSGNKTSVTFTVNASDAVSLSNVRFATWGDSGGQNDIVWYDGTNNGNGTWSKTVNFNSHDGGIDQHYNVHVYAYDTAGNNTNIATYDIYVDTVAPTVPTQTNGVLYATSNGVSWSAFADGASSSGLLSTTLYLQSWNGSAWSNVAGFPKSVAGVSSSFTGLIPATQYRWGVVYTDNASNANALTYTTFTTNTYAVSTVTNLAATGYLLNQKPMIRFTVTDANDATLTNLQMQVSTVNTFASTVFDAIAGTTATGWSSTSASSGATVAYTPQANIGTGTFYVRARAFDGKDWGTWSTTITFTVNAPAWATTVAASDTGISKRTIDDLRIKVNSVRQARAMATKTWTNPTITADTTLTKVVDLTEIRTAISEIHSALGKAAPTWTNPTITGDTTNRSGQDWIDLRNAIETD